jgi:hypothetical protein
MADVFRQTFATLSEEQKSNMQAVKVKAQELWDLVEKIVPADERSERARLVNIGKTDLEKSIMAIVKGITS